MTLQELEQLKHHILSERALEKNKKSPRITVGMGTCGIKAGAGEVMEELQTSLGGNKDVVVTKVGCIGLCSFEPVLEVALPGQPVVMYGLMTPEKTRKVVKEHILGGQTVEGWILSTRAQ